MQPPPGITQLLVKWGSGDQAALGELMPLIYDELRRLASSYLRDEHRHLSLQSTALVHEAYLRLVDQQTVTAQNRAQFFSLAATVMRHVLVDHARRHLAAKHDDSAYKLSLSQADRFSSQPEVDLVLLDDALTDLARIEPQHSRIVELRYFGGLSVTETAEVLGVSVTTVERGWRFARTWLRQELSR